MAFRSGLDLRTLALVLVGLVTTDQDWLRRSSRLFLTGVCSHLAAWAVAGSRSMLIPGDLHSRSVAQRP